jgi:predicted RNA-binding protein
MAPVAGFVGFAVPEVEGVPDAFFPEGVADDAIIFEEDVFFADDEDDLHAFQLGDDGGIGKVGDEEAGHVEVDVLVTVAVEEVLEMFEWRGEVVSAAEANHFLEEVRVFEGEVSGVVGAEAAAGGDEGWVRVFLLYEGHDLVEDIFFVLKIVEDAFCGVDMVGVEAFFVGAIEAVDLDGAGLYLFAKGVDDLPIFIIVEAGGAGGEKENGVAGMAEDQQFHIMGEIWTKPRMIFSSHVVLAARYCWMISFHKA